MNTETFQHIYEQDDGPLSKEEVSKIREQSSATDTPEEFFTDKLF